MQASSSPRLSDYLHLHFLVFIWSFTAILGMLVSVSSLTLVFYRTLLAALGMVSLLLVKGRQLKMTFPNLAQLLGIGVLVGVHWLLFFGAARVSNVSVCLAGMSTTSLWTSVVEPLVTGKRLRIFDVLMSLFVIVGLYLIFLFEFDKALGLVLALASALLAAVFSVLNRQLATRHDALLMTFYEMSGACLITLALLPVFAYGFNEPVELQLKPFDWLWVLLLAWACTVYPYSASIKLMRRFEVFTMNLTINLEPVYGIMLAFLIFGDSERMTTGFYIGTFIILITVLVYPWLNNRVQQRKN